MNVAEHAARLRRGKLARRGAELYRLSRAGGAMEHNPPCARLRRALHLRHPLRAHLRYERGAGIIGARAAAAVVLNVGDGQEVAIMAADVSDRR